MGEILLEGRGIKSSGMLVNFSSDNSSSGYADRSSSYDRCRTSRVFVIDVGVKNRSLFSESVVRGNGKRL